MILDRTSILWGIAAVATMVIAIVAPYRSMWEAIFIGMSVSCALNFYRESRP